MLELHTYAEVSTTDVKRDWFIPT